MKTFILIFLTILLFLVKSNISSAQIQYDKGAIGIGYNASMIGLWMLDIDITINLTDKISIESMFGLGTDGPSHENGKNYTGISTKLRYEFSRGSKLNLYGYTLPRFLWGSEESLGSKERKPEFTLGVGAGLGSESWNGYFVEFGLIKMKDYSSLTIQAGKHYYF